MIPSVCNFYIIFILLLGFMLTPLSDTLKVVFDYQKDEQEELDLAVDDIIYVTSAQGLWWEGIVKGQKGIFPSNYVRPLDGFFLFFLDYFLNFISLVSPIDLTPEMQDRGDGTYVCPYTIKVAGNYVLWYCVTPKGSCDMTCPFFLQLVH